MIFTHAVHVFTPRVHHHMHHPSRSPCKPHKPRKALLFLLELSCLQIRSSTVPSRARLVALFRDRFYSKHFFLLNSVSFWSTSWTDAFLASVFGLVRARSLLTHLYLKKSIKQLELSQKLADSLGTDNKKTLVLCKIFSEDTPQVRKIAHAVHGERVKVLSGLPLVFKGLPSSGLECVTVNKVLWKWLQSKHRRTTPEQRGFIPLWSSLNLRITKLDHRIISSQRELPTPRFRDEEVLCKCVDY